MKNPQYLSYVPTWIAVEPKKAILINDEIKQNLNSFIPASIYANIYLTPSKYQ